MSYTKFVYTSIPWVNKSEALTTPLGKTNLRHMDTGIKTIADNLDVVYTELDSKKFNEASAGKVLRGLPTWDAGTGILTFRFYDGTEFSIDFNVEKIPVSFSMDSAGVITMTTADRTKWTANIGELIPDYTFKASDRISFSKTKNVDGSYMITADLVKNSITGEYLQPNYLADIKEESSTASNASKSAMDSATNAAYDAELSQSYAIGSGNQIRDGDATDNAKFYKEQAFAAAESASSNASKAVNCEKNALEAALSAQNSKDSAILSATNAADSATQALQQAENSAQSATSAGTSSGVATSSAATAINASNNAAESAADAAYYYQQSKNISESFSGALRPMGTVTFANLPNLSAAVDGDMYNISDEFSTTSEFKEGDENTMPAGTNVYKTSDGYWDCLAGSPVTGVKGCEEVMFRRGNINITPEDIGLGNVITEMAALDASRVALYKAYTELSESLVDKVKYKTLYNGDVGANTQNTVKVPSEKGTNYIIIFCDNRGIPILVGLGYRLNTGYATLMSATLHGSATVTITTNGTDGTINFNVSTPYSRISCIYGW